MIDPKQTNVYADSSQHTGRDCSPDCAEYGCAGWTGVDRGVLAERRFEPFGEHVWGGDE